MKKNNILVKTSTIMIEFYQKYISPYKGYKCSHALVYGGCSCSNYGKYIIQEKGFYHGIILLKERFRKCSEAYTLIKYEKFMLLPELIDTIQYLPIPGINEGCIHHNFGSDCGNCAGKNCSGFCSAFSWRCR